MSSPAATTYRSGNGSASRSRALFRDAPFVILDEPTAALDARAESQLFDGMRELLEGRSVVLISHRFSSVRSADRIYVMHDGRVVEHGGHDELMAADGLYASSSRSRPARISTQNPHKRARNSALPCWTFPGWEGVGDGRPSGATGHGRTRPGVVRGLDTGRCVALILSPESPITFFQEGSVEMHRIRWARLAVAATSVLRSRLRRGVGERTPSGTRAAGGQSASSVKVGIIYSRTGLLSAYGAQYIQGLKLGLEYATKGTGKVNGKKIEITAVDDGTDPAKAVTAAKDLIGRGYKIIGGSTQSGIALQIAPLAEQNRVLNISGPAATDLITGNNRYTFRSGRQSIQDTLAVKEILGKGVGKKIVVLAQDSAFGQGNVAAVRTYLGGRGHGEQHPRAGVGQRLHAVRGAGEAAERRPALRGVGRHHWSGALARPQPAGRHALGANRHRPRRAGDVEQLRPGHQLPLALRLQRAEEPGQRLAGQEMKRRNQLPDIFTPDGFVAAQMIVRAVQKGGGEDVDKMIKALERLEVPRPEGPAADRPEDHAMLQPMFQVGCAR